MYRVLLVDDEVGILAALRRSLAAIPVEDLDGERLQVVVCQEPGDALQQFGEEEFDLVLSDYRMPGMSGVEMLTQMAQLQPQVARILLTGYADLEGIIGALNDAQVFRFIPKPWNDVDLRHAVCQALAIRALQLENQRLADLVRQQRGLLSRQEAELRRLEQAHPGITQLRRDESGAIVLDEDDD